MHLQSRPGRIRTRKIPGVHGGDLAVHEDTEIQGVVGGSVVVNTGCTPIIKGVVNGNLTLEKDSVARVPGVIGGDIVEKGGKLDLTGILGGRLITEDQG